MSIPTLPPLPAYPAAGPDRDEWHRLARLHMDAASIAAQQARAEAEAAIAAASKEAAEAQAELVKAIESQPQGLLTFEQHIELARLNKEFVNADERPA